MPVVSVTRKFANSSGRESDDQGRVTRTATEVYEVNFDGPGTPRQCETASANGVSIPAIGDSLDGDSTRRVTGIAASQQADDHSTFTVTVTYSSRAQGEEIEDPLARPAEVSWDWEESREPSYIDASGKVVDNSAGSTVDPANEAEVSDPVMIYVRNEATFNAPQAISYKDAVNSDPFTIRGGYIIPVGQAKMRGIAGVPQKENGIDFYRVTYRVTFRPYLTNTLNSIVDDNGIPIAGNISAWMTPYLDQGTMRKGIGSQLVIAINDDAGRPITEPRKLNGLGQPLIGGIACFRLARFFRLMPFSPLNLT